MNSSTRISPTAPLFDVMCTAAYTCLAKKLAMAIGERDVHDTIYLKQWLTFIPDTEGSPRLLVRGMAKLAVRIRAEADRLAAALEEEEIAHELLKAIRADIETRATHLLRNLENA